MNQNFDVYKKESGTFLGSVEAPDPKTASLQILGFGLATNRINAEEQNDVLVKVDENTFEVSIAGEEYTVKKSTRTSTND